MILVLGNGSSLNDYNTNSLKALANRCYTFVCNGCVKNVPYDVDVSIDPFHLQKDLAEIKQNNKNIVTRPWDFVDTLGIKKLYKVPMDCITEYKLSGILAMKLATELANITKDSVYILGIDHEPSNIPGSYDYLHKPINYGSFKFNVNNLAKTSTIAEWPSVTLPDVKELVKPDYDKYLNLVVTKVGTKEKNKS